MASPGLSSLVDFVEHRNGVVVALSDDKVIHRTLRSAIHRVVDTRKDCLVSTASRKTAMDTLKELAQAKRPSLLLVEHRFNGRSGTDVILTVSQQYPDTKIVLLTAEVQAGNIAYLFELGIAGVVVKPVSINNMLEKMSNAIKPPDDLRTLMSEGHQRLEDGDYDGSEAVAHRILEIKPGSPAGLMLLGDIHMAQDNREAAISSYLRAHTEAELYLEPLKRLVTAFKGLNDDKVLEYLTKLDWISPFNPTRKQEIGEAYMRRDDQERAEGYFDRCLELVQEELPSLYSSVASGIATAVEKQAPGMAARYLKESLDAKKDKLDESDIDTFNRLGIALRRQGKWREAVEEYDRALGIAPKDAGLHYNLALAWHDGNRRGEALSSIRKALELDPALPKYGDGVAVNIANVFLNAGSPERARPFFETALDLNPSNSSARRQLKLMDKTASKES